MKRRRFVGSIALAALGSSAGALLSGCATDGVALTPPVTALSPSESQTLLGVTRALFPHPTISDQPYLDTVSALDKAAGASSGTLELLQGAVSGLNAAAGGSWLDASVSQKVSVLESQQGEPYFGLVLNTAIDTIYRNPEVWALVGYEGSSLEKGGYLTRGFDDISWLESADGAGAE